MSNPGSSSSGKMGSPFFHEFKKQASFFLKEKIKTARLALTDVTPAQLLTEEATNGNPGAPDTRTLKIISRAAFEVDDYRRIVEILHKRLVSFDRKNWRVSYNALIVLEYLLTHGPESVAEEFQVDKDSIRKLGSFQHVDEKGFNWGLTIGKKSERILKLLENRPLLKEERSRARTVTRGIEGFGSFCSRTTSDQGVLQESLPKTYGKCNSQFNELGNQENSIPSFDQYLTNAKLGKSQQTKGKDANLEVNEADENLISWNDFAHQQMLGNVSSRTSFKENMAPDREFLAEEDLDEWNSTNESNPLLIEESSNTMINISMDNDHPFNHTEHPTTASLLSTDRILQAC